jgi:hypothetical protein
MTSAVRYANKLTNLVVSFNSKELAMVDASCEITISA